MIVPSEYDSIPQEKTAVKDWSAFSQEDIDARLEVNYWDVWGKKPAKLLALISSLEIRILYEDAELAAN